LVDIGDDEMRDMRIEDAEWNILRKYYELTPEEIFDIKHGKEIKEETKEKIAKGIRKLGVEEDDEITISEFYAYPLVEMVLRKDYVGLKYIVENTGKIRIIGSPSKENIPTYLRNQAEYVHIHPLHLLLPFPESEIKGLKAYEVMIDKEGIINYRKLF